MLQDITVSHVYTTCIYIYLCIKSVLICIQKSGQKYRKMYMYIVLGIRQPLGAEADMSGFQQPRTRNWSCAWSISIEPMGSQAHGINELELGRYVKQYTKNSNVCYISKIDPCRNFVESKFCCQQNCFQVFEKKSIY